MSDATQNVLITPPPGQVDNMFASAEPLWFDCGRWGECGYAIPNPMGKTFTNNPVIYALVDMIGRNVFELMHRGDVRFYGPPLKQFWYDMHQLLIVARKRMSDQAIAPNSDNVFIPTHATPTPQMFLVYPVPLFGDRVKQLDVLYYDTLIHMLLSDIMQHSDNEKSGYISTDFAAMIGKYLKEILSRIATKYFGATRADATKDDYIIPDAAFTAYDPSKVLTSVEMTEERPPMQWWPTSVDLSQIRGLPYSTALTFAKRWPSSNWLDAGAVNTRLSALTGKIDTGNQQNTAAASTATGSFIPAANVAP